MVDHHDRSPGRTRALRIPVAELIGRPGARREVRGSHDLADLALETTEVSAGPALELDLAIETIVDGLALVGRVHTDWRGSCRRCLRDVGGRLDIDVGEIFVDDATEAETWPIEADHIDLDPVIREAVLLALPLMSLCADDCDGPDPARFPTTAVPTVAAPDPRWAALDQLEFDDVPPSEPGPHR